MNPKARSAATQAVLGGLGVEEPVQAPEPQVVTDFADLLTEAPARPLNPFAQAGEQAVQEDVTTRHAMRSSTHPRLVRKDPMAEFHDALRSHLVHLSMEMNIESLKKMETFCRLAREMLAQCWVSK